MGLTGDVVMHDLAIHILKIYDEPVVLEHVQAELVLKEIGFVGGTHVLQQLHVLEVNALVLQVGHVLRVNVRVIQDEHALAANTRVQQRLLWDSVVQEQNFKS